MPQVPKPEVRDAIVDAALEVFAERGYPAASVADIARAAGVSTGNVYRYFSGKEELFAAALGPEVPATLRRLVRRRVKALAGIDDIGRLPAAAAYHAAAEEVLRFSLEHRRQVVILLARGAGTDYAGFAEVVVADLVRLALAHARSLGRAARPDRGLRFVLTRIYRNFVRTLAEILAEHADEVAIRQSLARFSRYHLAGMKALIAEEAP